MAGKKIILSLLVVFLLFSMGMQTASAYYAHQVFYDNPYYSSYHYPSYYTAHQYHQMMYNDHYKQYNNYYYYPPPRYVRTTYSRCLPEYGCAHPW